MRGGENVFPTGRPALPEDVVDREDFVREAVEHLATGHDLMLAGPRRIGKSSIAGEIMRRMHERGAYVTYVDAFHATSLETFATRMMQAALEPRTGIFRQAAKTAEVLRQWLGRAKIAAKIHDLELGIELKQAQSTPEILLELALTTAERIAQADDRRLVFVIDEFQDVFRFGAEGALKLMRATIQQQRNTVYLFLGSQMDLMQDIFTNPKRAFFRFALQMKLPAIPWDEWVAYIEDRLGKYNLTITAQALDMIQEKTGGHPHCVMLVAEQAFSIVRLRKGKAISADDVLKGYESAFESLNHLYAQQWLAVRQQAHHAAVLEAIADGRKPYSANVKDNRIEEGLKRLIDMGIITREGRGDYRLIEPMFGQWIRGLR